MAIVRMDPNVKPTPMDELSWNVYVEKKWHKAKVEEQERQLKDYLVSEKEASGIDRMTTSKFLGHDAAMLYMARRKGKPAEKGVRFQCYDVRALEEWMDSEKPETDCFAQDNLEKFAEWHF